MKNLQKSQSIHLIKSQIKSQFLPKQVSLFSTSSKYSDSQKLSEHEINSILKKIEKKPEIIYKHEFKYNHNYDQDIKDQLKEIQEQNKQNYKLKSENDLQTTEKQQEIEIENQNKNSEIQTQVKYYKYGLPIPNLEPELNPLPDPWANPEDEIETINERVFNLLRLNENTSYQQYELQIRNEFNSEEDMYGDVLDLHELQEEQMKAIGPTQCIPTDVLTNQEYMDQKRRCMTLNLNMPGVMENEHPHKFLKELRPIEDFRHTPIIPISDRQMKEHAEKVKAYHRRGFYFEIKKDSIYNGIFLAICCSIGFYLIKTAIKREEEIGVNMERLKINRMQNQVV